MLECVLIIVDIKCWNVCLDIRHDMLSIGNNPFYSNSIVICCHLTCACDWYVAVRVEITDGHELKHETVAADKFA